MPERIKLSDHTVKIQDRVLLKRVIYHRDRKALGALHAKHYLRIKRYIASRINSTSDAEDLAQNVFVALCKDNSHYNGYQNVEAYLFGIARNVIGRSRRREKNQPQTISMSSIGEIAASCDTRQHRHLVEQLSPQELGKFIEDAIVQLAPKAQEAIRLKFIEGLESGEAAQKAGCSISVFYNRVYDGIKALKKLKSTFGNNL